MREYNSQNKCPAFVSSSDKKIELDNTAEIDIRSAFKTCVNYWQIANFRIARLGRWAVEEHCSSTGIFLYWHRIKDKFRFNVIVS
ncbi:hypothetical protein CSR02_14125 [Acetobacter pomorum]|uniref:Uncharacterized protein n=1 Tax=Acetobacter pomorum TaxID=65959 RepID=A0A2G4R8P5_9PROT|nr:hypothetical protein CSR02_14125 [Acetobacter pomorum]